MYLNITPMKLSGSDTSYSLTLKLKFIVAFPQSKALKTILLSISLLGGLILIPISSSFNSDQGDLPTIVVNLLAIDI